MTYITHALGGAIAGTIVINASGAAAPITVAAIMSGAVIGSLLPDIDHTRSKISKSNVVTQVTSYAVSAVSKHRGFFHTPVFIAIVAVAMIVLLKTVVPDAYYNYVYWITIGLIPGMLSHLVLDTCNPGGIMWAWPITDKKISILPIKTSSVLEVVAATVLIVVLAAMYGLNPLELINK